MRFRAHRARRYGRRHIPLGTGVRRGRPGRHRRHLVGRAGGDLQRLFEGLPRGFGLGTEAGAAQGPRGHARHRRRERHGRHVELRGHGPHGRRRAGRHHLLGRRRSSPKGRRPSSRRSSRRPVRRSSCAGNGSRSTSTFPTPSWSKGPRRAATWVTSPSN